MEPWDAESGPYTGLQDGVVQPEARIDLGPAPKPLLGPYELVAAPCVAEFSIALGRPSGTAVLSRIVRCGRAPQALSDQRKRRVRKSWMNWSSTRLSFSASLCRNIMPT